MAGTTCISHPFLLDPGQRQSERYPAALDPEQIRIDGRSLSDLLFQIQRFAAEVVYVEPRLELVKTTQNKDEKQKLNEPFFNKSSWAPFFENSLPFLLARIDHLDFAKIEADFRNLEKKARKSPSGKNIGHLFDFIYNQMLLPLNDWQYQFSINESGLSRYADNLIRANLQTRLQAFVHLSNAAVRWYCIEKQNFNPFLDKGVWGITRTDLSVLDESFRHVPGGPAKRLRALQEQLSQLFNPLLSVMRDIASLAPAFLADSLIPSLTEYRQKHTPHLGLLFGFLRLFNYVQNDLNGLSRKHLEFFYRTVLQMGEKGPVADMAHLVFETQKHITNPYLLEAGVKLKDGKDGNKADILFGLADEIVIDKAQIASLKTLYLNYISGNVTGLSSQRFVEGLYLAETANSADGMGEPFPAEGPNSWSTLGAKYSKAFPPATPPAAIPMQHTDARVGFVLASPVLLLNEGKRKITINLECSPPTSGIPGVDDISNLDFTKIGTGANITTWCLTDTAISAANLATTDPDLDNYLRSFLDDKCRFCFESLNEMKVFLDNIPDRLGNDALSVPQVNAILNNADQITFYEITDPIFNIRLTGEKGWIIPPKTRCFFSKTISTKTVEIHLEIEIPPEEQAITFFDPKIHEEKYNTSQPVVELQINPDAKIEYPINQEIPDCCLKNCPPEENGIFSLYHFLRYLQLMDACIDVEVCGLKNFVVQNDENLQDVNSPIYPFGSRPDIIDFDLDFDLTDLNQTPTPNLVGPSFYIGSKEIFCKKWGKVWLNMNWKDKPSDFKDYYKSYIAIQDKDGNGTPKYDNSGFPQYISYGIDETNIEINVAILEDGIWKREKDNIKITDKYSPGNSNPFTKHFNRQIFDDNSSNICKDYYADGQGGTSVDQRVEIDSQYFPGTREFGDLAHPPTALTVDTRDGFLKLTLENHDFFVNDYAIVLARQMMALARLPNDVIVDAIYIDENTNQIIVFKDSVAAILAVSQGITDMVTDTGIVASQASTVENLTDTVKAETQQTQTSLDQTDADNAFNSASTAESSANALDAIAAAVSGKAQTLQSNFVGVQTFLSFFDTNGNVLRPLKAPIPPEPYVPVLSKLTLDYTAKASKSDIELIHLYPFPGTNKTEDITATPPPTLLPTFVDEGSLFIGLKDIKPGSNLNLLFQFAEATADSESKPAEVKWHYLRGNAWVPLQNEFHILDDKTDGLTRSGIVKIATPGDISASGYTIMPQGLYWLKVSAEMNVSSVCEAVDLHSQAVLSVFNIREENDTQRLYSPLAAGSLTKLELADSSIKKISQPYESFGGRPAESGGNYHRRISEQLRHKGRGIQRFDYERLVLEQFPEIFEVKCLNHDIGLPAQQYRRDLELAPGFVTLAVIPDLNKLKTAGGTTPKAPLSLLEEICGYIQKRLSAFVRLKVVNPRYEKIDIDLKVKLVKGKDVNFYSNQLKEDLTLFLAPWRNKDQSALTFGRSVAKSDLIFFIENLSYVDFICQIKLTYTDEKDMNCQPVQADREILLPQTARSILTAGEIKVAIDQTNEQHYLNGPDCFDKKAVH